MRIVNYSQGLTFVEVLVAIFILAISTVSITGLALLGSRTAIESERQVVAQGIVNERMEFIRSLTYDMVGYSGNTTEEEIVGALRREQEIKRGGQTYQLETYVEPVDDDSDGTGVDDPDNIDYKRVRVEARWRTASGNERNVTIVTNVAKTPITCTPGTPATCPVYGDSNDNDKPLCEDVCTDEGCPTVPPTETISYVDCPESGVCPESDTTPTSTSTECEPGEEFCLSCASDNDCAANESCVEGQCENACDSLSCGDGETCNETTGACTAECDDNSDCSAGQMCDTTAGFCVATNDCTQHGCAEGSICDDADPNSPTYKQCIQMCNESCGCPAGQTCNLATGGCCDPDVDASCPTPTVTVTPTPTASTPPPPPTSVPPSVPPPTDPPCDPAEEDCDPCDPDVEDCDVCGDGGCGAGEDVNSCTIDCPVESPSPPVTSPPVTDPPPTDTPCDPAVEDCDVCGDESCGPAEDEDTCTMDCPPPSSPPSPPPTSVPPSVPPPTCNPAVEDCDCDPAVEDCDVCGDESCGPAEDADSCTIDCPVESPSPSVPPPTSEPPTTEESVPPDDGGSTSSPDPGGGGFCGDGSCGADEDTNTCSDDCDSGGGGGGTGGGSSGTSGEWCDVDDDGFTDCGACKDPDAAQCEPEYGSHVSGDDCEASYGEECYNAEGGRDDNGEFCVPVRPTCCYGYDEDGCKADDQKMIIDGTVGYCEQRSVGDYDWDCEPVEDDASAESCTDDPNCEIQCDGNGENCYMCSVGTDSRDLACQYYKLIPGCHQQSPSTPDDCDFEDGEWCEEKNVDPYTALGTCTTECNDDAPANAAECGDNADCIDSECVAHTDCRLTGCPQPGDAPYQTECDIRTNTSTSGQCIRECELYGDCEDEPISG